MSIKDEYYDECHESIGTNCMQKDCPYYNFGLGGAYCDKTGGKQLLYGTCTEYPEKPIHCKEKSKRKRRTKRERDIKYKQHLKHLEQATKRRWYAPVYSKTEEYLGWHNGKPVFYELQKPYYKRLYRANHKGSRFWYYKKHSSKIVRRYKCEIPNGNAYRKLFDYWWQVY